jgi:nitrogen fixation-related uncharacterized protein
MTFIEVWVAYAVAGVMAFSAVLFWAVRTRQFSDFDRARFIALDSSGPDETSPSPSFVRRGDRWAVFAIGLIALGVIAAAIWIGLRNL